MSTECPKCGTVLVGICPSHELETAQRDAATWKQSFRDAQADRDKVRFDWAEERAAHLRELKEEHGKGCEYQEFGKPCDYCEGLASRLESNGRNRANPMSMADLDKRQEATPAEEECLRAELIKAKADLVRVREVRAKHYKAKCAELAEALDQRDKWMALASELKDKAILNASARTKIRSERDAARGEVDRYKRLLGQLDSEHEDVQTAQDGFVARLAALEENVAQIERQSVEPVDSGNGMAPVAPDGTCSYCGQSPNSSACQSGQP